MRDFILFILVLGFIFGGMFTLYFLFSGEMAAALGCLIVMFIFCLLLNGASS